MQTRKDFTAVHLAAQYGHARVVELLLHFKQTGACDVDFIDPKKANDDNSKKTNTPLMLAVRYGHTEVVKLLLSNDADVNRGDSRGWHSLHRAANAGHTELVELLLEKVRVSRSVGCLSVATPDLSHHSVFSQLHACPGLQPTAHPRSPVPCRAPRST